MLIDFIDPARLPWVAVWLEWNVYVYRYSLISSLVLFVLHHQYRCVVDGLAGLSLALFVGFCAWVVYCAMRYGYAVG